LLGHQGGGADRRHRGPLSPRAGPISSSSDGLSTHRRRPRCLFGVPESGDYLTGRARNPGTAWASALPNPVRFTTAAAPGKFQTASLAEPWRPPRRRRFGCRPSVFAGGQWGAVTWPARAGIDRRRCGRRGEARAPRPARGRGRTPHDECPGQSRCTRRPAPPCPRRSTDPSG
jgi:hypothetical protein